MPASLSFDPPAVALAEAVVGIQAGEPKLVRALNDGDTFLRDISITPEGDGRFYVQLAKDMRGEPGVWAQPGQSISPTLQEVRPGGEFYFWARGVFDKETAEGEYEFNLKVELVSG